MKIKQKNTIDMTHGTLWNKLLIFALPLAASSILQQLFNSVDTAVVGRFASSRALAAVGSNSSLIALMINLFIGISLGSNVIISRYIGQKAEEHVKAAIHTAIVVALCSGIFVLVLGQFIARPVLTLMGTPKDVLDLAVLYLRIYFLGMPFIMLYDFSSSILRSIGDSRRPLYALIAAGIINTGLNLILVIVFHLGVSGVAIATVVSNIVSSGILFYILLHEQEPIRVSLSGLSIDWGELKKILIIGVPAGLQGMVFSLANVCIQSMINSFGSNAIAGSAAALNFEFFCVFYGKRICPDYRYFYEPELRCRRFSAVQKSIPSLHDFFRDILWSVIRYFCTWPGLFPSPVHDRSECPDFCRTAPSDRHHTGTYDLHLRDQRRCHAWLWPFPDTGSDHRGRLLCAAPYLDQHRLPCRT